MVNKWLAKGKHKFLLLFLQEKKSRLRWSIKAGIEREKAVTIKILVVQHLEPAPSSTVFLETKTSNGVWQDMIEQQESSDFFYIHYLFPLGMVK